MRVAILGNSGSGKSTLARQLAGGVLPVLDLDTVAWEPGAIAVRRDPARARADVTAFCERRDAWIIEGCYASLIGAALQRRPTLIFLDPGVAACQHNCRSRPWEPHKYASATEQDARLEFLLQWVGEYDARDDELSRRGHEALYAAYDGPKEHLTDRPGPRYRPPGA